MIDQQLLVLGIIAMCMVIITTIIIFATIQHTKTMHKVDAFIVLGQDGLSTITQESSDLLKKLGDESRYLTSASIALKAYSQFFQKNPDIKEDKMNKSNLLSFTLGAAITGVSAYYVFKNKDDISNKISALEETLADDYGELVDRAKEKLEELSKVLQSTAEEFLHGGSADTIKENELKQLVKKLDKLQKEIESLHAKS